MSHGNTITVRRLSISHLYRNTDMKFVTNTETKPVVGKQAERLSKAISTGSYVANEKAQATAKRIFERYKKPQ